MDVLIKSKFSDRECNWESGWNCFSKYSIEQYCERNNYQCAFVPFHLGIDIPKHTNDPLRSWTVDLKDNSKMTINGLQLVHNFYLLKIRK